MPARGSDAQLVTATLEGDQAAFGELVARYKDAVFGVAFHRLGDFEEARDVAQDAFVKAYVNLPKLRDRKAFANWLYRIADGTAVDAARRRRDEVSLDNPDAFETGTGRLQPAHGGLKPAVTPAGADALVVRQVRDALAQLPKPDRLAVVLHYVNGYSHAEVAQFLGTTARAVKTRVSRAKAKLRKEMAEMVERKLKEEGVFCVEATDESGRVIWAESSGARSAAQIRRALKRKGYRVTVVRHDRRSEEKRAAEEGDPIERVANVILDQALKDKASAITLVLGRRRHEAVVHVKYHIGATWHEVMCVPQYVWSPLRAQFARMAGVSLSGEAPRQSGTITFPSGGAQRVFRVVFRKRTSRIDVLP